MRPITKTSLTLAMGLALGCAGGADEQSYEGELRMFAVDNADGTHRMGYGLQVENGRSFELVFDGQPSADPGSHVLVRGQRTGGAGQVGERLEVRSLEVLPVEATARETTRDALAGGTARTAKVAILPLVFPGSTAAITVSTAQQRLSTVQAYYKELSYGTWTVQGTALSALNMARPANCDLDTINNSARAAAKSQGINLDVYDHVAFVIPNNSGLANCACGLAWVGNPPTSTSPSIGKGSLYTCTDANAFAHEMGHGFGMTHASAARCGVGVAYRRDPFTNCGVEEYGNAFNTMGGGLGHMTSFHKSSMGWLNKCNNVYVSRNATYDLIPIQTSSTGIQSLRISTGGDTEGGKPLYYYVEYRNPALATFNAGPGDAPEVNTGVHINVAQDARSNGSQGSRPLLLDLAPNYPNTSRDPRLTAGRTYTDPDGRVSISVLSQDSGKARVRVTFPNGGSGTNVCSDGTQPTGGITPGGPQDGATVRLTATHSGKCLDVAGSGTDNGTLVQQWTCNGTNAQAFRLQATGNGAYSLVNTNSGKCLDVASSSTDNGGILQIYDCNGTNAQSFQFRSIGNGTYSLVNSNSAKCVDVYAFSTDDGGQTVQYDCNGLINQQFTLQ
jgi:M6 family metalloprotease-like protein